MIRPITCEGRLHLTQRCISCSFRQSTCHVVRRYPTRACVKSGVSYCKDSTSVLHQKSHSQLHPMVKEHLCPVGTYLLSKKKIPATLARPKIKTHVITSSATHLNSCLLFLSSHLESIDHSKKSEFLIPAW